MSATIKLIFRLGGALLAASVALWGLEMTPLLWTVVGLAMFFGVGNAIIFVDEERKAEKLNQTISDLLASNKRSAVPVHLQNLSGESSKKIKEMVDRLASEMRLFEANSKEGRPNPRRLSPEVTREERHKIWEQERAESFRRSDERHAQFNQRYRPLAVSLRDEMRKRLGLFPPYADEIETIALDLGMLAGPSPITDAANALEGMARRLHD